METKVVELSNLPVNRRGPSQWIETIEKVKHLPKGKALALQMENQEKAYKARAAIKYQESIKAFPPLIVRVAGNVLFLALKNGTSK